MRTKSYYPAFLDLSGRRCVVFGGGRVALRKVKMLLESGGRVEVVAPQLCGELNALRDDGTVAATSRRFEPADLDGAFVVIAATDDAATNERIASEARRRNVLVNVVDVPQLCDFIVPSCLRRGDLTVAISTSGSSPALAKKVRTMLESEFGEEYSTLSRLVGEARADVRRSGIKVSANDWESALDMDLLLGLIRQGKDLEARKALITALDQKGKAVRHAR